MTKKAVVLYSGGLDSTTCMAIARDMGFEAYALSFNYGQRHAFELSAAERVARELGVPAVVGCGDATMRLDTGDRVRVDGGRGVVEILEAAESQS